MSWLLTIFIYYVHVLTLVTFQQQQYYTGHYKSQTQLRQQPSFSNGAKMPVAYPLGASTKYSKSITHVDQDFYNGYQNSSGATGNQFSNSNDFSTPVKHRPAKSKSAIQAEIYKRYMYKYIKRGMITYDLCSYFQMIAWTLNALNNVAIW